MDAHVKFNLRYLKGMDGVPTIESGLIIDNSDGDEYLQIPSLTTTERDALTPVNGMTIYNETTTEFNKYENGGWKDLGGGVDHGGLDGLGDDDHTQYQKENLLTTAGDIVYATGASAWARLGIGTNGQYLRTNAGATAPEWTSGVFPQYGILIWHGTIANIPAGFVICDGNNSTPNLLTKFLQGVATAGTDPGATGGAATHTHSLGLTHDAQAWTDGTVIYGEDASTTVTGAGDSEPTFYDVAFIMKS